LPTRKSGKSNRGSTLDNPRLALSPFTQSQINKSFVAGSAQKHTDRTPADDDISTCFAQHDVDYVMCFISHADRDHWNKIHLLPDNKPTLVFINGWIDVEKFNSDMIRRKNIVIVDTSEFGPIINQGLGKILENNVLQDNYHLLSDYSSEYCAFIKEDLSYITKGLNDVHFWALNPKATDQNGHSYVVSCRFPLINTSILCTGDATAETFEILEAESMTAELAKEQSLQTFLMMPHHGSRHNVNNRFLDFLKRATVNAFIVPSGNGAQYGHPSKRAIQHLQDFWNNYTCFESTRVGSYVFERVDSPDRRYNTELYETKLGSVPFFGTNLMGAISLKSDGSWASQKLMLLTIEGQQFEADLSKRSFQYVTIPTSYVGLGAYQQFNVYKKTSGSYCLILAVFNDEGTSLYLEYALSQRKAPVLTEACSIYKKPQRLEIPVDFACVPLFSNDEG
jgi:hypothetical protein